VRCPTRRSQRRCRVAETSTDWIGPAAPPKTASSRHHAHRGRHRRERLLAQRELAKLQVDLEVSAARRRHRAQPRLKVHLCARFRRARAAVGARRRGRQRQPPEQRCRVGLLGGGGLAVAELHQVGRREGVGHVPAEPAEAA